MVVFKSRPGTSARPEKWNCAAEIWSVEKAEDAQGSVTLDVLLAKLFPSTVGQARQLPSAYYVFCVLSFLNFCRLLLIILEVVFRARPRTFNAMHSSLRRHALKS